ncbi:uncharacterized protein LOC143631176 [Bidens hawaiensis]|uniref:uncharacterized protein LOC143631176 n=1 Tax=Bidens hawaiensis TaxID=980011 RepID=UPI00404B3672
MSIRTVNEEVCETFRAACEKLGLLGDDVEWSTAFEEASVWATASELRALFTQMLLFCEVTDPLRMWEKQWHKMADVGMRNHGIANDDDLKQYVLYELELLLQSGTPSKSLLDYSLPMPRPALLQQLSKLNLQQSRIYEDVTSAVASHRQILVFVYGHGGTGKTFLWTTILSALRSTGSIVLAVAASGIASLLLPSGRTTHSRFKLPLDVTDNSLCHIKKNTQLAHLLTETSLIIWDEAPMNDRRCFESLDRSLRDLFNCEDKPFGGKSVLLGGDFTQTLPIISKASKSTILASSLPRSYLWHSFKVYKLTDNMRLHRPNISCTEQNVISVFSSWLVSVGDGVIGSRDVNDPEDTKNMRIPDEYLIRYSDTALTELIHFIYNADTLQNLNATTLSKKAIICPKNETVNEINSIVINMTPGTTRTYTSIDSVVPHPGDNSNIELLYPVDYSNSTTVNRMEHNLIHIRDIKARLKPQPLLGDGIEVMANLNQQEHFDEIIKVKACYMVTEYVCVDARKTNKVVDHEASLRIGIRATFAPITDASIPTYYFRLATHDSLRMHRVPETSCR